MSSGSESHELLVWCSRIGLNNINGALPNSMFCSPTALAPRASQVRAISGVMANFMVAKAEMTSCYQIR